MANHAGKLIVKILEKSGVRSVWGITGDSANFITCAIFESPIAFMHVRHEEAGALACGAESQVSGELGVCIGSCGPGALHLVNGLYEANKNHNPVLCLATHIPSQEIGTNYVQETDVFNLFTDCSVFCQYVQSVEQLPRIMGIAMQTAISKKGVAVLIIPGDISSSTVRGDMDLKYIPHYTNEIVMPDKDELTSLAECINDAKNIALLVGNNSRNSIEDILNFAELLKAPIGYDLQGKSYIEWQIKDKLGCLSKNCRNYAKDAFEKADLILMLGVENPPMRYIPQSAKLAYIDSLVDNVIKTHNVDFNIYADLSAAIKLLEPMILPKKDNSYALEANAEYENIRKSNYADKQESGEISYEYLFEIFDNIIPCYSHIISDIGEITNATGIYIKGTCDRDFYYSNLYRAPGATLPLAMGIRRASEPQENIIAICSYSGLQRFLGELLTLRQLNLNIKVAVINQDKSALCLSAMAQSLGVEARRVSLRENLEKEMGEWIATEGCSLIQIDVLPNQ